MKQNKNSLEYKAKRYAGLVRSCGCCPSKFKCNMAMAQYCMELACKAYKRGYQQRKHEENITSC